MIPRNPDYIQRKSAAKGETPVEDRHRQAMLQTAVQGTFIKLLPLEAERANLSREEIRAAVQQMHPANQVIWVGGDDKGECPEHENTCLVNLPGWGQTVIIGRNLAAGASSTQVRRNLMQTGDEQPAVPRRA